LGKLFRLETVEKKISFLLVVPYTIPEYSGSGINAFNFASFLTNEGIKATILTFNRKLKYSRKEVKDNILIRRIIYFNQNLFTKIISLLFIIPVYSIHITRNAIIMVYGGHLIGYEFILTFARWLGKKTIFQSLLINADDIQTLVLNKPEFLRGFYKKLFAGVSVYHSINPIFSVRYRDLLNKQDLILEVPQGVDIETFSPVSEKMKVSIKNRLGISEKIRVILSVGFIIPRKGFSGIFEALKDLDLEYIYIIAGEYNFPESHFLSQYALEASETVQKGKSLLGDKLILTGPIRDIQKYYQIADIMIFNSIQEGLPNSLLEAMACGVPVLTRNIPGLDGFILNDGKNCFTFNNEMELRDRIQFLCKNQGIAKEIGSSALSDIRQRASFQNVLSAYNQRFK
jgi:glycosyltransferase involved in cell wall biosynthesis